MSSTLNARYQSKHFIYINTYDPPNNPNKLGATTIYFTVEENEEQRDEISPASSYNL